MQNKMIDLNFLQTKHYDSIDKKDYPSSNIGTLYERVISNLNSEIAFLKKQHATKDNYFQEEILFLRKSLNEAFQKLNK